MRAALFIISLYLPFQWFCMQRASLGAIKLVPLKQKILIHINLHRLPHVPSFCSASYCGWMKEKGGKGEERHSLMTLFQSLWELRGLFTRKPQIWFGIVLAKSGWGASCTSINHSENASSKSNQKLRRFFFRMKRQLMKLLRSPFFNFMHDPSQHPFPLLPSKWNKN